MYSIYSFYAAAAAAAAAAASSSVHIVALWVSWGLAVDGPGPEKEEGGEGLAKKPGGGSVVMDSPLRPN